MTLLDGHDLAVSFGAHPVLRDVDISLAAGEVVGLIGPNAAGKTTLARVLSGLLEPNAGEVRIDGRPLARIAREEIARTLAYLSQGAEIYWPLTAERLVSLGRLPHLSPWQRPSADDWRAVRAAMEEAEIGHIADRPVTSLSGGERARVLFARALAAEPRLLIADEPVAQLDPYHQIRVMELLRGLAGRGAVMVVLHDLALAARYCDRLVLLNHGRIEADGPPERVLTADNLRRVYGVTALLGRHEDRLFVIPWRRDGDDSAAMAP